MSRIWKSKHFTKGDIECKCMQAGCPKLPSGETFDMLQDFLVFMDGIWEICGFRLPVSSGWRCENHPVERVKKRAGLHNMGTAMDIKVSGYYALLLIGALTYRKNGALSLGINQKGAYASRFIHVALVPNSRSDIPHPHVYSYS